MARKHAQQGTGRKGAQGTGGVALFEQVKGRQTRAIARALTLAENGDAGFLAALDSEYTRLPQPARIGITGPPGSGKSTLTSALVAAYRKRGNRVGVVAVDPSSPFSGGALLGDRLRMSAHSLDEDVFVRSMASRGRFGGLAIGCEDACDVLALAGFDPVIVETVGVGQSEVDIARLADTTVVVLNPGAGDSVQALKAGIMEIAEVLAINKADKDGAERLEEDVKESLELRQTSTWKPPLVRTVATEGRGADDLLAAIDAHRSHLEANKRLTGVRASRAESRLLDLAAAAVLESLRCSPKFEAARKAVLAGKKSPRAAVAELLKSRK